MPHPDVKVEIAFNTSGTETWWEESPAWTDVTADVLSVSVERGRNRDSERFGATSATVTLENNDREYDPWNESSVWYVAAKPYRKNLIRNALMNAYDYELNALDWFSFWGNGNYGYFGDLSSYTLTLPFGDWYNAGVAQGQGTVTTIVSENIAVEPNETYYWSAYVGMVFGADRQGRVGIEWYNSSGTLISSVNSAYSTVSTTTFVRLSVTQQAPATAATARVLFYSDYMFYNNMFYLQHPLFEKSTTLRTAPYADGAADPPTGWEYDGTLPSGIPDFSKTMSFQAQDGYSHCRPRKQIRIRATTDGSTYVNVWRGWISAFPVSYVMNGKASSVTLECYDGYSALAQYAILPDVSSKELSTSETLRFNEPLGATVIGADTSWALYQTGGTTGFTKIEKLAPNVLHDATSLGVGNTWRSNTRTIQSANVVTTLPVYGYAWVSFWWATNNPAATTVPVTFAFGLAGILEVACVPTGAIRVRAWNSAGTTYTEVTSTTTGYNNFQPHHIYVRRDNGVIYLFVDGQSVAGTATSGSGTLGETVDGPMRWMKVSTDVIQDLTFGCDSISGANQKSLAQASAIANVYYGVGAGFIRETAKTRFSRLMYYAGLADAVYSPQFRYLLPATESSTIVGALASGGELTPLLDTLADTEQGPMFCTKDGKLTFFDQGYAYRKMASAAGYTVDDTGAAYPFGGNVEMRVSNEDMYNTVTVTYSGGYGLTVSDSTSVTKFGTLSENLDTVAADYLEATEVGRLRATTFAKEQSAMSEIVLSTTDNDSAWDAILALELLDRVDVEFAPLGGSTMTRNLSVQQIRHEIKPKFWRTTIRGSSRFGGIFVLDASTLDGTDRMM